MNACHLLSFQAENNARFQALAHGHIDAGEATRLAEASDAEWAAVQAMRDCPARSPVEIAARAEVLAALIDGDRYDPEIWIAVARQIAFDLRAITSA